MSCNAIYHEFRGGMECIKFKLGTDLLYPEEILNEISIQIKNSINTLRAEPDIVIINPANKFNLESLQISHGMPKNKLTHIFNMQIIWSENVGIKEIVCAKTSKY